ALPALRLILQVGFENGLKLRRQRRAFLAARLGRLPLIVDAGRTAPLAVPVRVFRLIVRLRGGQRQNHRGSEDERAKTATRQHHVSSRDHRYFPTCRPLRKEAACLATFAIGGNISSPAAPDLSWPASESHRRSAYRVRQR